MSIFKEAQIRKMLGHLNGGAITLSRFTEILNKEAYISLKNRGEWVSMIQVVQTLEAYLAQNDTCKTETEIKIKTLIDYMKTQIIESCIGNLERLK